MPSVKFLYLKPTNDSWRMDETYLKIKGENAYLYRAVDSAGYTIDFFVSEHRDKDAAKKFFKKALQAIHNQQPRVITTDKYAATEVAICEMIYGGILSVKTTLRKIKYLFGIQFESQASYHIFTINMRLTLPFFFELNKNVSISVIFFFYSSFTSMH